MAAQIRLRHSIREHFSFFVLTLRIRPRSANILFVSGGGGGGGGGAEFPPFFSPFRFNILLFPRRRKTFFLSPRKGDVKCKKKERRGGGRGQTVGGKVGGGGGRIFDFDFLHFSLSLLFLHLRLSVDGKGAKSRIYAKLSPASFKAGQKLGAKASQAKYFLYNTKTVQKQAFAIAKNCLVQDAIIYWLEARNFESPRQIETH